MAEAKALYELGETPPRGHVPRQMYASLIRPERYGEPRDAFQVELVDVPSPGPRQALVWVMAAGVKYNNVWAALGQPVDVVANRQKQDKSEPPFHIGGSDASGIVWAVGEGARVKVGDEAVLSCAMWDEEAPDIRAGADPITSTSTRIRGYEVNWGSFAQFTLVDDYQCHPKPARLSWEAAAAYMLVGATAYRQLTAWEPHVVRPGDPVLIWGGSGGLGSMAIQIVKAKGGIPIAVVSSNNRIEHCMKLGAHGVIDRTDPAFTHWSRLPDTSDAAAYARWMQGANAFRKRWSEVLGSRQGPRIVLEHPGESTIPTSIRAVRQRRHGGDLCRHDGLQRRRRPALLVDAPEATARFALRQHRSVPCAQRHGGRGPGRPRTGPCVPVRSDRPRAPVATHEHPPAGEPGDPCQCPR